MQRILLLVVTMVSLTALLSGATAQPRGAGDGWSPYKRYESVLTETDSLLHMGARVGGGRGWPGGDNANWSMICNGSPAVITNSVNGENGNGACAGDGKPVNTTLSCSCLKSYANLDVWQIRVKSPEPRVGVQPPVLPSDAVLGVNKISGSIPWRVKEISIVAATEKPLVLQPIASFGPNTEQTLLNYASNTSLTTLTFVNITFVPIDLIKPGFIPPSVKKLTVLNGNISRIATDFIKKSTSLVYLDLSNNSLTSAYQDVTLDQCRADPSECHFKSLNLSYNVITTFPSFLLNFNQLEELDLSGNPMTNVTISNATFTALQKLKVFKMDVPTNTIACQDGRWMSMQNARVCITDKESTIGPLNSTNQDSKNNSYIMYAIIGCSVVVLVSILLLLYRRRRQRPSSPNSHHKNEMDTLFDNTLSYEDETQSSLSATLLNDPIIITNRIPYKEIRVANCISKGGFGLIYSGVYQRRRVAIKKIRPDRSGDVQQVQLFLREICLMATLVHPRIVEFVGVAWDSLRNLSAVTEFMERGDLRDVLDGFKVRNQRLTWENHKTKFALEIAEALVYLHSLKPKVIHRDLKSKNVLVNADMEAKLSDFGISRERRFEETHMTAGIGTSFWIAPEVLLGRDYDEHADIFSFGVVLSEIDTDDYPYWNAENPSGGNQEQNMILQLVASGAMRPNFSETCPKEILELADLCLQVDPDVRPSAAEIVFTLQQLIHFTCLKSS